MIEFSFLWALMMLNKLQQSRSTSIILDKSFRKSRENSIMNLLSNKCSLLQHRLRDGLVRF